MNVSTQIVDISQNSFLVQLQDELKKKEIQNVEMRCHVAGKLVQKSVLSAAQALSIKDSNAIENNSFKICIPPETYTQHINEWKGISSTKKHNQSELKKFAQNWSNGRRASILATQVFPQLIQQSIQYCEEFANRLFPNDEKAAHDFFCLCEVSVLSCLLSSNVKLNSRSAETPLICHNSLNKHKLSDIFFQYLPENYKQCKFQNNHGVNDYQKIFEDLYNKRLLEFQDNHLKKSLLSFESKKVEKNAITTTTKNEEKMDRTTQILLTEFDGLIRSMHTQIGGCSGEDLVAMGHGLEALGKKLNAKIAEKRI